MLGRAIAVAAVLAAGAAPANAAAVYAFSDTEDGVVGILSGSLDLTGLTPGGAPSFGAYISPMYAELQAGPGTAGGGFLRYGVSGPARWGNDSLVLGTVTGDGLHILGDAGVLALPESYIGGPLSARITFPNADILDWGLVQSSFVYRLEGTGDTLTFTFGDGLAEIPLPASLPALAAALALLGLSRRRCRAGSDQT